MSVSVHVELDHHCYMCGDVSAATVMGVGLDEQGAQMDAASLIRLARCPRCGDRNLGSQKLERESMVRNGLYLGAPAALVLLVLGGGLDSALLTGILAGPVGIGLTLAVALGAAVARKKRLASDRRVNFLLPASEPQGPYRSRT